MLTSVHFSWNSEYQNIQKKRFQFYSTAPLEPICPTLALGVVLLVKGHQAREIYSMTAVMLIYVTTKCQPNLLVSVSPVLFVWDFPSPLDVFTHMEYGDVTFTGDGLQILTSTWHYWPLSNAVSSAFCTYFIMGPPFVWSF